MTFTLISFDHLKAILLWAVLNRLVSYVIILLTLNGYLLKLKLHGAYIFLMKAHILEEISGPCMAKNFMLNVVLQLVTSLGHEV